MYSNEVVDQTYSLDVKEINLRSGNLLQEPPNPMKDSKLKKYDTILPQAQEPPYPKRFNMKKS